MLLMVQKSRLTSWESGSYVPRVYRDLDMIETSQVVLDFFPQLYWGVRIPDSQPIDHISSKRVAVDRKKKTHPSQIPTTTV